MKTEEIINWITELFEESPGSISIDTDLESIPAWDSLGVLNLIAELDENYDIILEDEDILELRNVENIIDIFRKNGNLE